MKKIHIITIACFIIVNYTSGYAQGCSDAGFCTVGNLAAHKAGTGQQSKHTLKINLPVGIGDAEVFVFTPGLEYNYVVSSRWSLQGKLTGNYASGTLGSADGLGDVYLSGTYVFNQTANWKTSATLGTKLPLNQGNLKESGRSLPMQYQSSLGTIDLIVGLAAASDHWQFAAGWQQPLSGRNRNNFLPVYWAGEPTAMKFPPSNDFDRKGDVLFRSAYAFSANQKWNFNAGLLGIYHLGEDTYIDANISNTPIAIEGSQGLTLNITAAASFQVSEKISIGFSGGMPLIVRDVRPDGLTRKFVFPPKSVSNFKILI